MKYLLAFIILSLLVYGFLIYAGDRVCTHPMSPALREQLQCQKQ